MNTEIRIPRFYYEEAIRDLHRPHPHAGERVGFYRTVLGTIRHDYLLVLVTGYDSIPDEQYVRDFRVGARISSASIQSALQRILSHRCGQLHVHAHIGSGVPLPSPTDQKDTPRIVESMRVVGPKTAHGMFIFSDDGAWAQVAIPGAANQIVPSKITVVGYPSAFLL